MKSLSEIWKQKKHVNNNRNLTACSTPNASESASKARLAVVVKDVSPIAGFGNSQLFSDAEFLRNVDELEEIHEKLKMLERNCEKPTVTDSSYLSKVTTTSVPRSNRPHSPTSSYPRQKKKMKSAVLTEMELISSETDVESSPRSLFLADWNLPQSVLERYHESGIESMFEWQADCIGMERVLDGANLVYSAPTSAGKTLVAEILVLKCVLERKKKAVVVLPFVSVAQEKTRYLAAMFRDAGVRVDGFMGNHSPLGGFAKVDVAVCTIERANSLVNRLLEEGAINQLGIVVVDELHMLGDPHRGYLLELLLTKIKYVQSKQNASNDVDGASLPIANASIQIVGMSATLPNLDLLARWLDAELFTTEFRPVPLTENLKVGFEVWNTDTMEVTRTLDTSSPLANDPDHVVWLCLETVADGNGVLVFCPTKTWCEKLADTIAKEVFELGKEQLDDGTVRNFERFRGGLRAHLDADKLSEVLSHLARSSAGLDRVLARTISFGVAFHHAGLTFDEREIIEGAFRRGVIKILTATSTLSSGVNLPARRVIVRTPIFYGQSLDVLVYRQMIGRAGRKGLDETGESILICKPSEYQRALKLVKAQLKPVCSCLALDSGSLSSSMKRAILEIVVSGAANNPREVKLYASCTLLACTVAMGRRKESNIVQNYIEFLVENEFIRFQSLSVVDGVEDVGYVGTPLGRAVLSSALSPDEGLVVYRELERARRCFVLENELHVIYQVTPIYLTEQWSNLNWCHFLDLYENLSLDMRRVAECVGIDGRFLLSASRGRISEKLLSVHLRFYTALALHDLVNEVPLSTVARKYGCNRGMLQSLQQSAATFAGMVTIFCHQLGWFNLELLLAQFQSRLHFGVQQELCDLLRLTCLTAQRARVLFDNGYKTVALLAVANKAAIETVLRNAGPFQSDKQKDNETEFEMRARLKQRSVWIPGRQGIAEAEAASLLVSEARDVLQKSLGLTNIDWAAEKPIASRSVDASTNDPVAVPLAMHSSRTANDARPQIPLVACSTKCRNSLRADVSVRKESNESHVATECCESKSCKGTASERKFSPLRVQSQRSNDLEVKNNKRSESVGALPPQITSVSLLPPPIRSENSAFGLTLGASSFLDSLTDSLFNDHKVRPEFERVESPQRGYDSESNTSSRSATPDLFLKNGSWMLVPKGNEVEVAVEECEAQRSKFKEATEPPGGGGVVVRSEDIEEFESPPCLRSGSSTEHRMHEISIDSYDDDNGKANNFIDDSVFDRTDLLAAKGCNNVTDEQNHASYGRDLLSSDKKSFGSEDSGKKDVSGDYIPPTPSPKGQETLLPSSRKSFSSIGAVVVVDVLESNQILTDFLNGWKFETRFSVAVAAEKQLATSTIGIGRKSKSTTSEMLQLPSLEVYGEVVSVHGFAVCWDPSTVHYVSFVKADGSRDDTKAILSIVDEISRSFRSSKRTIVGYDLKEQLRALFEICGQLPRSFDGQDPRIAAWLLDQESADGSFTDHIREHLPEKFQSLAVLDLGSNKTQSYGCPGLTVSSQRSCRTRSTNEAVLSLKLMDCLIEKLKGEGLFKVFTDNEMPSVVPLVKLELNGLGFDDQIYVRYQSMLQTKLKELESRSQEISGRKLNFASPQDVAQILYVDCKLSTTSELQSGNGNHSPIGSKRSPAMFASSPSRFSKRLRQRLQQPASSCSTKKSALHKLGLSHELPNIILEWRRLQSTLTKIIVPMQKMKSFHPDMQMYRLHGSLMTHTATGRVVMSEPSLQMVPRDFELTVDGHPSSSDDEVANLINVCLRSAYVPFKGGVLIAGDYSQLELRVLAHLSADDGLIRVLNGGVDVFQSIAAQWKGRSALSDVTDAERQHAKQICYGMIYGMGSKALGEQLGVEEQEAAAFMASFKLAYPGIDIFIKNTLEKCRQLGYVETLMGRRRRLPNITSANCQSRSQAERQAINTTIQGSASDIAKRAMIDIDEQMSAAFSDTDVPLHTHSQWSEKCRMQFPVRYGGFFVLQLHDELMYEVAECNADHVAQIVRKGMEGAVSLHVKLPVKLRIGPSWGALKAV